MLWILLFASGLVLAARAVIGPFRLGLSVNSPINAESWFSFAALALLLTCAAPKKQGISGDGGGTLLFAIGIVAAIGAAFGWSCPFPFTADDYAHVAHTIRLGPGDLKDFFTVVAGDRFFRPLGYISYFAEAHLWGWNRAVWHAFSLLLHAANSLLVFRLARVRNFGQWTSAAAALLFALAGSRPEAVTWIAAQFDLWATLFFLVALLALIRVAARGGRDSGGWESVEAVALLLALLSKESAYAFPLIAFALLWIDGVRGNRLVRLLATPAVVTGMVFLYRWRLLGGIGGYRLLGTEKPLFYSFDMIRVVRAFLMRLPAVLTFPINWTYAPGAMLVLLILAAIAAMAGVARAAADRKKLAFGLAFMLAAAAPVYIFLFIGPDLEKSRVLYLPSIGFALTLAAAFEAMPKRIAIAAACALVAFQVAALEHNLLIWRDVANLAERTCQSVASAASAGGPLTVSEVPNAVDGVYFLHTGFRPCVEWAAGKPLPNLRISDESPDLKWDDGGKKFKPANELR